MSSCRDNQCVERIEVIWYQSCRINCWLLQHYYKGLCSSKGNPIRKYSIRIIKILAFLYHKSMYLYINTDPMSRCYLIFPLSLLVQKSFYLYPFVFVPSALCVHHSIRVLSPLHRCHLWGDAVHILHSILNVHREPY